MKIAVLVLVWCCKSPGDREQSSWRYWPPEGCSKKWYDKRTGYGCLSKKCWLGEQCSSDIAVSCNLAKHSDMQRENTSFETLWFSPLAIVSINATDSSLFHLLFLMSLNILLGCLIINICGCRQDLKLLWTGPMAYNPHTRFYYSKLLTCLSYDYGIISNTSGIDLGGSGYRQVLNCLRC